MDERRLHGKVAIVTGAGRGLGRSIAQRLAADGAAVVINDLDAGPMDETYASLKRDAANQVQGVAGDVADPATAQALVATATEAYGRLDVVVNNAGMWRDARVEEMDDDLFDLVVKVNLYGTWYLTKRAWEVMRAQRAGSIVNFTSPSGIGGNFGQANYSAAKAGVIGLTKATAKEFGRRGVRVNCISPMADGTRALEGLPDELVDTYTRMIPMGRFGDPAEIAAAVAFLASDDASYVTGQVIGVDGGFTVGKP